MKTDYNLHATVRVIGTMNENSSDAPRSLLGREVVITKILPQGVYIYSEMYGANTSNNTFHNYFYLEFKNISL